jgi:hypothetical protein
VLRHFAELPVTPDQLHHVTELWLAPSLPIYHQIDPLWDGESLENSLLVGSFEDVVHLPRLHTVHIEFMIEPCVDLSPLHQRGIEVTVCED